jgi:magnesium chelatase family protein
MSLSVVYTRAALGVKAPLISVEVHLSSGLPGLTLVGLPETTVKEARDRVRSAIINSAGGLIEVGIEIPATYNGREHT